MDTSRSRETADIEVVEFAIKIFAMKIVLTKAAWPTVAIFLVYELLAGSVAAGLPPAGQTSNASSILEPASGALLGIFYGAGSVDETSKKLGRALPVHLTYYAWDADWNGNVTKADLAAGRIPLVNWEPHHIDFHKIIDGSLDATITARANGAKALGKKFFLDFAAEMNGDEAWGGNNPTLYVAAYRHVHDIFTAAGAAVPPAPAAFECARTCSAPGPWHRSQAIPSTKCSLSK